jgi:uncharacterized protein
MERNRQSSLTVAWQREYRGATIERATFLQFDGGARIDGELVGCVGDYPVSAKYTIRLDDSWRVRSCVVEAESGTTLRRLILTRRGESWFIDGFHESALAQCDVLDLGFTPSTNTIALNRLRLPLGGRGDLAAVYVDFPSLEVSRSRQGYLRMETASYEYRNLDSGFTAPLSVDDSNLVVKYGSVWHRLTSMKAPEADVLADARTRQFCRALISNAPSHELDGRSADFDWLIGGWSGVVRDYSDNGTVAVNSGEWWFSWILEGRAMQDVWMVPPPSARHGASRLNNRYGTTTRRFSASGGLWCIAWINPVSGAHTELRGRRLYDRIVLEGTQGGTPIRWSFVDITPSSFRWTGERQTSESIWRLESEFILERLA